MKFIDYTDLTSLSYSVQAAMTEYHRLGGLIHLFLIVLEARNSKIKVPARSSIW